jgi:hypothetical protein
MSFVGDISQTMVVHEYRIYELGIYKNKIKGHKDIVGKTFQI